MKTPSLAAFRAELRKAAHPDKAQSALGFFKTGAGQYGEGDVFIGVTVPEQRRIAKRYPGLPLADLERLLRSKIHEERLSALFLLVARYRSDPDAVVKLYLRNLKWVNNWDLVDSSAPQILGTWLLDKDRSLLTKLARSKDLWERRVAMVSTQCFINAGESKDALKIAALLLDDGHDLIHKATGWMLREVGKRVDPDHLRAFLKIHAAHMPRTALRYSIERLPKAERANWIRPSRIQGASK
ncbi:MAG: DNA alkylation repair protein [candidate division FCPU426 bacterium]